MLSTTLLSVDDLAVGMYVAKLDRPWLETPFLFQGFYIRDDDEIAELRQHCEFVYVASESVPDQQQSRDTSYRPAQHWPQRHDKKRKKPKFKSLLSRLSDLFAVDHEFDQTNVIYEETATLKQEIPRAEKTFELAATTVQGVMDNIRNLGNLDVSRLQVAVQPMVDSVLRHPAALACLVRMQKKDEYLYQHSIASSVWATVLGRELGLVRDDLDVIALGAMLLDIGKTRIPVDLLTKPDRLTEDELVLMRRHVEFGLDILSKSPDVDMRVIDMVRFHHERYNGTGYPKGVSGNSIPVFGRIAGIVDAYDAMITPRPYARLYSSYDAIRKLQVLADVEFQAEIVDQFTKAIGAFPTGTLVELNTGEIAIVTKQNRIRRLRPEVLIIIGRDGKLLENYRTLDLDKEKISRHDKHSLWIARGLPPGAYGIDPTEFYLT